jgi:hypothetical protein
MIWRLPVRPSQRACDRDGLFTTSPAELKPTHFGLSVAIPWPSVNTTMDLRLRAGFFPWNAIAYISVLCAIFMRQLSTYIGLIFILGTIQCSRKTNDSLPTETTNSNLTATNTVKKLDNQKQKRNVILIVKDSTQYSRSFLAGLRAWGPGHKFELNDNEIVTDDFHQTIIIQLIPKGETVVLHGQKNNKKYEVRLKRIDYTSVSYEFLFTDDNGKLLTEQGIGELRSDFMLGSGMDEDDKGLAYGINSEYWTNDDRKNLSSIRLGVVDKQIVGRIHGEKKDFTGEEAPFLKSGQEPAPLK